jgi:hypothetical protein
MTCPLYISDVPAITATSKKVDSNFPKNFSNLIIITKINDSPLCDGPRIRLNLHICVPSVGISVYRKADYINMRQPISLGMKNVAENVTNK